MNKICFISIFICISIPGLTSLMGQESDTNIRDILIYNKGVVLQELIDELNLSENLKSDDSTERMFALKIKENLLKKLSSVTMW